MWTPPPPRSDIDWTKANPLTLHEVNGHVETSFNAADGCWTKPRLVRDPYVKVHGLSPSLNYGMEAYEGLKAFRTFANRIQILEVEAHAARMKHSAQTVAISPVPPELFIEAIDLAVARNAEFIPPAEQNAFLYIRPVLFVTSPQIAIAPPTDATLCVYVQAGGPYHGNRPLSALVMEDFDRAAPKGTGSAKIGGNYAPVIPHDMKARRDGYGITLHLDSKTRTEIEEFSTSAFLGVLRTNRDFTLVASDSKHIVQSVTSTICLQIARQLGWNVEERPIKYSELSTFSEVFAAGTAASLVPIKSVFMKSTGDEFVFKDSQKSPGPACQILRKALHDIQRGNGDTQFYSIHTVSVPTAVANL